MTTFVFANNAGSTLAAPISSGATSITLAAGTGDLFPAPGAGEQFTLSLTDVATGQVNEIVYCTARSSDTLTVVRAQEGTAAAAWTTGDFANHFVTAGTADAFAQGTQGTMAAQNANAVAITGGAVRGVALGGLHGNTASRPATPSAYDQYFDTDIGQPIWCKSTGPNVWVNAAGVSV